MDYVGIFLVSTHLQQLAICALLPVVTVFANIDPLYLILQMFLPPANQCNLILVVATFVVRFFMLTIFTYECSRFSTIHFIVFLSIIFTMNNCLRTVIRNLLMPQTVSLKFYNQLSIIVKAFDQYTRCTFGCIFCIWQVIIVSTWWLVLKCSNILPFL